MAWFRCVEVQTFYWGLICCMEKFLVAPWSLSTGIIWDHFLMDDFLAVSKTAGRHPGDDKGVFTPLEPSAG